MNDNFANRELSIDELETIAAGGWLSTLEHGVSSVLSAIEHVAESAGGAFLKAWGPTTVYAPGTSHRPR